MDTSDKNNKVIIREGLKTDIPFISHVLRATLQMPYGSGIVDEKEVEMELGRIHKAFESSDNGRVFIAENEQDQGLGFAFIGTPDKRMTDFTHSDPSLTLELRLLYLDPAQRSKGVGSILIQTVEQEAKNMSMSKVELTSGFRFISIGAGVFYEKKGYKLMGIIPNYFEGRYPANVYQKAL